MSAERVVFSDEVVGHLLARFGERGEGTPPGVFVERLLDLLAAADDENLDRLRGMFPEYVDAFLAITRTPHGLDFFRALARDARVGGGS